MKKVTVSPKGMGLNDFVAKEEGFSEAEGLDVTFDWKTFRGTQSSWKGLSYFERPSAFIRAGSSSACSTSAATRSCRTSRCPRRATPRSRSGASGSCSRTRRS